MSEDEREIRALVSTWMEATRAGDTDVVLSLMTDDVVFLRPGCQPMHKAQFAAAAAQQGGAAPRFEASSEIRELNILGDWAYLWTWLEVTATLPDGSSLKQAGDTLTLLRRERGRWRLARDANMLTRVSQER
jgi:uncharacterized protein (TIGR02246 family)